MSETQAIELGEHERKLHAVLCKLRDGAVNFADNVEPSASIVGTAELYGVLCKMLEKGGEASGIMTILALTGAQFVAVADVAREVLYPHKDAGFLEVVQELSAAVTYKVARDLLRETK